MTAPTRYARITDEIIKAKARWMIEVGTWNGDRALEMLKASGKASPDKVIWYFGFDLFEAMTAEKSALEFNVKAPCPRHEVANKLSRALSQSFGYRLFPGDTRDTLPEFMRVYGDAVADFAWIDGGHSIETITSDWSWCKRLVKPGGLILLDDYYSGMAPGFTDRFGCNGLVSAITGEFGAKLTIFPEKDPVAGGGYVQIVRVER